MENPGTRCRRLQVMGLVCYAKGMAMRHVAHGSGQQTLVDSREVLARVRFNYWEMLHHHNMAIDGRAMEGGDGNTCPSSLHHVVLESCFG